MPTSTEPPDDNLPYWADAARIPHLSSLGQDVSVDVVVVGGGVTGLTAAYLLTKAGQSVAVLERGRCARLDSGRTSAHLTMVTDRPLTDLAHDLGPVLARGVWQAGLAAIDRIDGIVRGERIDCAFARLVGYRHGLGSRQRVQPPRASDRQSDQPQADDRPAEELRAEAGLASELGFDAAYVPDVPLVGGPGVRFAGQARFDPLGYAAGLVRAVLAQGGRIYEHSEAATFAADPPTVVANGHTITCRDFVIATHIPIAGICAQPVTARLQARLSRKTSYVVAGRVPKGVVTDALFWDTGDPYHYLRFDPGTDHDVVIFGGEDHESAQPSNAPRRYGALVGTLRGFLSEVVVTHRWHGHVIESVDGLPFIGRLTEHQYFATGCAGNGLTFGTLGAMICTDAILGRANPWAALFAPDRPVATDQL